MKLTDFPTPQALKVRMKRIMAVFVALTLLIGSVAFAYDDAYLDDLGDAYLGGMDNAYLDDLDNAYPDDLGNAHLDGMDNAYLDDLDNAYPDDLGNAYLDDMDDAYLDDLYGAGDYTPESLSDGLIGIMPLTLRTIGLRFTNGGALWPVAGSHMYVDIIAGPDSYQLTPGLPVRAGYTLREWDGEREQLGFLGTFTCADYTSWNLRPMATSTYPPVILFSPFLPFLPNSNPSVPFQPTTRWLGANAPSATHYPMHLFLCSCDPAGAEGWIQADFVVVLLSMNDREMNIHNRLALADSPSPGIEYTRAVVNSFDPARFVTDVTIENLTGNTIEYSVAPLQFVLPNNNTFFFDTSPAIFSGSASHITTEDFIDYDGSFMIPIYPNANLGAGTHTERIMVHQRGHVYSFDDTLPLSNASFGFTMNNSFPLVDLTIPFLDEDNLVPNPLFDPDADPDNVYFDVEFKVMRPVTDVAINNPRDSATRNSILCFGSYEIVSAAIPSATLEFDTSTTDPAAMDVPAVVNPASFNVTLSLTCNYSFFDSDASNNTAIYDGAPLIPVGCLLTAPGYRVNSATVVNGNLVVNLSQVHTITFDLDGGDQVGNLPLTPSLPYSSAIDADNVPVPTRANYTFVGWMQTAGPGSPSGPYANAAAVGVIPVTGPKTFVAIWEPVQDGTHLVTFNLNGGNIRGNTANITHNIAAGSTVGVGNIPFNPSRASHSFAGWSLEGQSVILSAAEIAAMEVNGPLTFVANWRPAPTPRPGGSDTVTTTPSPSPSPTPSPSPVPSPSPSPSPSPTPSPTPTSDPTPSPSPTPEPEVRRNIMIGYNDRTMRPNNPVPRSQSTTMFFRELSNETRAQYWSTTNDFTDVRAHRWYNNPISTVVEYGLVSGFPDGTFRPNDYTTYAEMLTLAARFNRLELNGDTSFFNGNHWATRYMNAVAAMGWIEIGENFNPDALISRASTSRLFLLMSGSLPVNYHEFFSQVQNWADVRDRNAWYYVYIFLATNSFYIVYDEYGREVLVGIADNLDWSVLEQTDSEPWHLSS